MYNKFKQSILKVGLAVSGILSVLVGFTTPSQATLIGQNVTVEFSGDNTNFGGATFSDVVMVGAGAELTYFDGSDIGDNVFLDNELIDIGDASIFLRIEGGGPDHATAAGFTTTGLDATAQYSFTNLVWGGTPGTIIGVSVVCSNMVADDCTSGMAGSEVSFTGNSVTLNVGTLGVAQNAMFGGAYVGSITLNLDVTHDTTPPPQIPEPSSILLFGTGAGLAWLAQRRRTA